MTKGGSKYYWWCQIGGWSFLVLVLVLAAVTSFEQRITNQLIYNTLIVAISGLIVTHIFREIIRHRGWIQMPVEKALPKFLIGILLTCVAGSLIRMMLGVYPGVGDE